MQEGEKLRIARYKTSFFPLPDSTPEINTDVYKYIAELLKMPESSVEFLEAFINGLGTKKCNVT